MHALLPFRIAVPTAFTNVQFTYDKPSDRYYLAWQSTVITSIDCKSLAESKYRGNATFQSGKHTISMSGASGQPIFCSIYNHKDHEEYMISNFGETNGMSSSH